MAEQHPPGPHKPGRPPRPRRRSLAQHDLRDARARLRGTIYEHVEPDAKGRDQYTATQIVDFCLDLAEVMLASGADTRSVETAVVAVSTKWNLAPLDLDFSGSSVTIQYAPADVPPLVKVRTVRSDGSDLDKLARANQIVDDLIHDDRDMTSAVNALVAVLRLPPRWPTWLVRRRPVDPRHLDRRAGRRRVACRTRGVRADARDHRLRTLADRPGLPAVLRVRGAGRGGVGDRHAGHLGRRAATRTAPRRWSRRSWCSCCRTRPW